MSKRRSRGVSAPNPGKRGVSLTEVMVSMCLLALAVLAFGASFPACSQQVMRARHEDLAVNACQKQLDYWRQVGYTSAPLASGVSSAKVSFTPPTDLTNATGYTYLVRVDGNFSTTTAESGLLKIVTTVTWSGSGRDKGSVSLTSLIRR